MITSPPIVPTDTVDPLDHPETICAVVGLVERLAHAKREGDVADAEYAKAVFSRVPDLRDLVHLVANGLTYRETQGSRRATRDSKYREECREMAKEYSSREIEYATRRERISFGDLAEQIGRLPRFSRKRRASITAIKRGLKLLRYAPAD